MCHRLGAEHSVSAHVDIATVGQPGHKTHGQPQYVHVACSCTAAGVWRFISCPQVHTPSGFLVHRCIDLLDFFGMYPGQELYWLSCVVWHHCLFA